MDLIKMSNVSKSFGSLKVLENLNFEIKDNQILCLVGPSGCGKSTILNLLSLTYTPDSGQIINLDNAEISYVFQKPRLLPWRTIEDNMKFILEKKFQNDDVVKKIKYWLKVVELDGCEKMFPNQLSGGMEQRAALARAFSVSGNLLLMDEPFKGLDEPLKFRMLDLVFDLWQREPKSIVFVTHDIREALLLGHKIIVLKEKPTKVIEEIDVDMLHDSRHIGCHRIAKLEEYIYRLIDKKSHEDVRLCNRKQTLSSNNE